MGNGSSKQRTIPTGDGSNTGSKRSSQATTPRTVVKKTFKESYTLARDLGSGAFSVVKLAVHKVTGRNTAVKIISKKKLSEEDLAALMTEINILCELNHPHIIKCYETFDEGADFYIVTELVAGGELFDRIVAKTHYTEKEARDLVKMFLETMAYMHEAGVVHRDLKPENLLLCSETDDSDIKIADFGFAKKTLDLLPTETACGTPGYVAPEILRGDPYGTEVDIWSMGVICYVLLAGYPPFYDEDQKKLFKKIKEGKYHFHQDYWGSTSPDAMDMIRKMLCVNQKDRWSARQLLGHAWIIAGDDELRAKDLTKSIEAMKKFKAKMRFKAVAKAIMATKRMQNAFKVKPKADGSGSSFNLASMSGTESEPRNSLSLISTSADLHTEFTGEMTATSNLLTGQGVGNGNGVQESPVSVVGRSGLGSPRPQPGGVGCVGSPTFGLEEALIIQNSPRKRDASVEEDSDDDDSHLKACID